MKLVLQKIIIKNQIENNINITGEERNPRTRNNFINIPFQTSETHA